MGSSMTQFDQFEVLTEQIFYEMIASGFHPEEIPEFASLAEKIRKSSDTSFTGKIAAVREELGIS